MSLLQVAEDIRMLIYGGIRTLPLTLAGTLMIIGLMTANYPMLFFLLAYLIAVPLLTNGLNLIGEPILNILYQLPLIGIPFNPEYYVMKDSNVNNLVVDFPGSTDSKSSSVKIISLWIAMTMFFMGYILSNAVDLFNYPVKIPDGITDEQKDSFMRKGEYRRSQAMFAIISIVIITLVLIGLRAVFVGSEKWGTVILSTGIFGLIGSSFYNLLSQSSDMRLSDMFGIANSLLSPDSLTDQPVACLPVAS
jgi:hypothetical protein